MCVCILKVIKFFSNSCSLGKLLLLKAAAHFVPDTSENSENFSLYSYRLLNGASNLVKIANFAFFSEFFFQAKSSNAVSACKMENLTMGPKQMKKACNSEHF